MHVNKYIVWIAVLLAVCISIPADAQRRSRKRPAVPKVTVEELIQSYRFDEATQLLHEKIEKAEKDKENTDALEADLHRATLGANMLRGTERVLFVDSIKVARSAFLKSVKLSPESGYLVPTETEKQGLSLTSDEIGQLAHINELNDRMFFSMKRKDSEVKNLCSTFRSRDKWSAPHYLSGIAHPEVDQDYPFVMPDGVTLYYAAKGEASLGGYDLFVTRYDPSSNKYLKAENLGMPFNSLANDYMLAIDETNCLGWLVTDRFQSADTVCIYIFVPNESREIFDVSTTEQQQLIRAAKISNISECRYDAAAVTEARQRLMALAGKSAPQIRKTHFYVINNTTVYKSLDDFCSEAARRIAVEADKVKDEIDKLSNKYDDLTYIIAQGSRNAEIDAELRMIKEKLPQLKSKYHTLCKNMRQAEMK